MVKVWSPRSLSRPARRRSHIEKQDRLTTHTDRPAIARLPAAPRVEIAAEIDERVPAEGGREPTGEPTLRDAAEIDRRPLSKACRPRSHLKDLRQRGRNDRRGHACRPLREGTRVPRGEKRRQHRGVDETTRKIVRAQALAQE